MIFSRAMNKVLYFIFLSTFVLFLAGCDKTAKELESEVQQENSEQTIIDPQEGEAQSSADETGEEQGNTESNNLEDLFSSDFEFLSSSAPSALSTSDMEKVALVNDFAFSFARQMDLAMGEDSYVLSPVSMAYLLGMLANGADGDTRSEICKALGFGEDGQDSINEFCRNLIVLSKQSASKDEQLDLADVIVLNNDKLHEISLYDDYREQVKNYYDADACDYNFSEGNVAKLINSWANERTHGLIPQFLDESLDYSNQSALFVNALYFRANWAMPFDEYSTITDDFTSTNGSKRQVEMMNKMDECYRFNYVSRDLFEMLTLPYGDPYTTICGNYSMHLLLPKEGISPEELLNNLNVTEWTQAIDSRAPHFVYLKLPRFTTEQNKDMKSILEQLGINSMFNDLTADFGRMSPQTVYVSMILQAAKIILDESGTEAAAVSSSGVEVSDNLEDHTEPDFIEFFCNRPFLYAITENATGAILFLGCYK